MKKSLLLVLLVLVFSISTVAGDDDVITLTADLHGVNEVPAAINSNATASFKAFIHENGSITFTETFQNLTSNAILSHIHFGKDHVLGGVMIFLCGGGGQPACPVATSGTFSGSITPANVTGVILPENVPEVATGHAGCPPPPHRKIMTPPAT